MAHALSLGWTYKNLTECLCVSERDYISCDSERDSLTDGVIQPCKVTEKMLILPYLFIICEYTDFFFPSSIFVNAQSKWMLFTFILGKQSV